MGIFSRTVGRVGRLLASIENPAVPLTSPEAFDYLGLGDESESSSGVRVNHKNAVGYPAMWRGINLICDGTRKLGLHLYRKKSDGGRERFTEHAAYRLVRRKPNEFMTAGVFRQVLTFHAVLYGNGYAAIIRDAFAAPRELLILDPTTTVPVVAGGKLWYVANIRGELVKLESENVLHLRRLSRDGINGLDLVEVFSETLGLGLAARKFGSRFFKNGAKASGILMIPGHIKKEAQENILAKWSSMATKLTEEHKVALIQDGAKYQQLTISPEQGQFLQTRLFENREVSLILGVPPHKLGDTSRTSYNSLEQEERAWLFDGLDPWLVMWEEECGDKLLTEEEKESEQFYFRFNREEALQMSFRERMEGISKGFATGLFTVNDQLRMEDRPTIGAEGDIRFRPANLVPLDFQPAPKQPAPPDPKATPPGDKPAPPPAEPAPSKNKSKRQRAENFKRAHYAALRERFAGALKIEAREVAAAAARESNFVEWLDRFYARHEERVRDGISATLFAYYAARTETAAVVPVVANLAENHCRRQKELALAAAECPRAELVGSIEAIVQEWSEGTGFATLDDWAVLENISNGKGRKNVA